MFCMALAGILFFFTFLAKQLLPQREKMKRELFFFVSV